MCGPCDFEIDQGNGPLLLTRSAAANNFPFHTKHALPARVVLIIPFPSTHTHHHPVSQTNPPVLSFFSSLSSSLFSLLLLPLHRRLFLFFTLIYPKLCSVSYTPLSFDPKFLGQFPLLSKIGNPVFLNTPPLLFSREEFLHRTAIIRIPLTRLIGDYYCLSLI
jgi:hypothetical protein